MSLVRAEQQRVVLENERGLKVVLPNERGYGHAEVFLNETSVGMFELLHEQRVAQTFKTPPYVRVAPLDHRFANVDLIQDAADHATIRFSGGSGFFFSEITLTLQRANNALAIAYAITPTNAYEDVSESPYFEMIFAPPHARMDFVQYPFHAPLTSNEGVQELDIEPVRHLVPFMFGKWTNDHAQYFCGAGYGVDQPFWQGRFQYRAAASGGGIFRLWPLGLLPKHRSQTGRFSVVLAFGATQADCIHSYRQSSNYDMTLPQPRTISKAADLFMSIYKRGNVYVPGIGYHQQIKFDTGEPFLQGYGRYISICSNVGVAHSHYLWWMKHPEELWARDRALEIANFFMQSQADHGGVPNLLWREEGRYMTYAQQVKEERERSGLDTSFFPQSEIVFTTHMLSMAAYYLYRMAIEREKVEKHSCEDWKRSALRAIEYLIDKVQPDGLIGRNFSLDGEYDDICANIWFLIALDYIHTMTHDARYDEVRTRVENWVEETFARSNHWFNWSADAGWWRGHGYPIIDHDAFEVPTYATYCIYRFIKTKKQEYLQRAKDALAYVWLCMIPIQYDDYTHLTKGLIKEQDTYSTFDVPFNTTRLFDGLPLVSLITGNRFYMEFYRFLQRVQLTYQAVDREYPAFYIGLDWAKEDVLGEADHGYISEFAGVIWIDSILSQYCFAYLGGRDWCIGLDEDTKVHPVVGPADSFVAYSTLSLVEMKYVHQEKMLELSVREEKGMHGIIGLGGIERLPSSAVLEVNGEKEFSLGSCYDTLTQTCKLPVVVGEGGRIRIRVSSWRD